LWREGKKWWIGVVEWWKSGVEEPEGGGEVGLLEMDEEGVKWGEGEGGATSGDGGKWGVPGVETYCGVEGVFT
jgi:hypothetical protein